MKMIPTVIPNQLRFTGFNESLLSTIRHFNLFDVRKMYESLHLKQVPICYMGKIDGVFHIGSGVQRIFRTES